MKHLGDITKINGAEIDTVDVITGGSPCQDLSVAGKRAGLAGERSGLFMEQMRIVKEMRENDRQSGRTAWAIRPRYMVWENVPGAFSSGNPKGSDFAAVIEEIIKVCEPGANLCVCVPDSGWTKSGCYYSSDGRWSIAWRVHDAQFWGVPQRRKRIALVADFGGLSAPEILFERKGLSRDPEPCEETGKETAGAVGESFENTSCFGIDQQGGKGHANYTENVCPPILSDSHGTPHAVTQPILLESNQNHATVQTNGISTALPASMGMGGGYVPMVTNVFGDNVAASVVASAYKGPGNTQDGMCICIGNGQTNNISMKPIANTLDTLADVQKVMIATKVRRLTPFECERLQGFPDGWTDIGEWTDSKGKKHKEADSPRYKALGNSIAIPFWQFLARRICAQYERPVTLGSLFDGIGGFPLAFSRCGAIPVWASEIEEFPIAVTKIHFPEEVIY